MVIDAELTLAVFSGYRTSRQFDLLKTHFNGKRTGGSYTIISQETYDMIVQNRVNC